VLVFLGKTASFGMAPKAEFITSCRQKLWMARSVGPVAGQALSCLVRFVAVFPGHEPFLASMTALAQLANLLLNQLFMLRGMGIVTPRTFKLSKRLMSPFLSQLLFYVWVTR
jgi:hypothetical protein